MTKLVCKNTDSDTAIRFPSCPKANIVCHSRHSDLKAHGLITVMAVARDFHPNFPVCDADI